MSFLTYLFFWNYKDSQSNAWHPYPGANPTKHLTNLPAWTYRLDPEAAVVDTAPFAFGAGALAHLRQLNDLGWTAQANIFKNPRTLRAVHRTTLFLVPVVLALQVVGVEYRYCIPRWAHERERGRDEEQVRQHVEAGMGLGALGWVARMTVFRNPLGRKFWAPVEVVLGGGLADLMHREFVKAHGHGPDVG